MTTLFLASLLSTPWALQPDVLRTYARVIARRYGDKLGDDIAFDARGRAIEAAPPRPVARTASGSIAVLPLYGAIMQRAGMLEMCGGGTSTQSFTKAFREAMDDDSISQILIDIDSPGGSVYGVGELATEIRNARGVKPVVGIANSVAASAAYWIGSACSELYVMPGGQVGSIGVVAAHEDVSKQLEAEGVNVTIITAGKYKAEGNPYGPLDPEARASIQADVNSYGNDFNSAVARGRGVSVEVVRKDMGQGRMLRGGAAIAAGMVDGVMTFDDVLNRMRRGQLVKQGAGRGASALRPNAIGTRHLNKARNELSLVESGTPPRPGVVGTRHLNRMRNELTLAENS